MPNETIVDDILYANMCKKAGRLQFLWVPTPGDFYIHDYRGSLKGTSKEFEMQIWGDHDKTWFRKEVLCYQPDSNRNIWIANAGQKESVIVSTEDIIKDKNIWLPSQERLQGLLGFDSRKLVSLFQSFQSMLSIYPIQFTSINQIWLAIFMLYNFKEMYVDTVGISTDRVGWVTATLSMIFEYGVRSERSK